MRIISGSLKGRRLRSPAPKDQSIRPTSERAREALFNILGPSFVGKRVLDLFAGTGALSLEAISRGAELAVAVDNSARAQRLLRENRQLCGCNDSFIIRKINLTGSLDCLVELGNQYGPFSAVFLDPPYGRGLWQPIMAFLTAHRDIVTTDAIILVEEESRVAMPERVGDLLLQDQRQYGLTGFGFYGFKH